MNGAAMAVLMWSMVRELAIFANPAILIAIFWRLGALTARLDDLRERVRMLENK